MKFEVFRWHCILLWIAEMFVWTCHGLKIFEVLDFVNRWYQVMLQIEVQTVQSGVFHVQKSPRQCSLQQGTMTNFDKISSRLFKGTLKGHSRDTLCLGTDISCWIWLVGFCSLNISAAFTLSPPAIGLKACQAGWAGTSAAQLSDLLRNYSVGQWHFTGWIVFLNHVKVLLGCLYVSYKHILASWSINTTFHRFSL